MKRAMAAITIVALSTLGAVPAIAQDRDAARAACNTFAQLKTEAAPSASPRLDTPRQPEPSPPAATPPPAGGVQAPGAGAQAPGTAASGASNGDLAGKSPEFKQAFTDCMTKLGS